MSITASFAIIILAALIHASFQLSISVLTLFSGHMISARLTQIRLSRMITSFVLGVGVMTVLLLSFISLLLLSIFGTNTPQIVWASTCGLLIGLAFSVWIFYYRREKGTTIWIPRNIARYLNERTKSTKLSAEAFGLGLVSVIGELLFIITPLIVSALVLIQLPTSWQLIGIIVYAVISLSSLIIVWVLIGSGHNLGTIQKWRETNKYFLQFAAGTGLVILSFFIYVYEILNNIIEVF
ncbi:MAG: hypothetical protein PWQ10_477 [Patescibacteria group bacterium]|nr:hypothetical protein [Patescibacteria group bacterium]